MPVLLALTPVVPVAVPVPAAVPVVLVVVLEPVLVAVVPSTPAGAAALPGPYFSLLVLEEVVPERILPLASVAGSSLVVCVSAELRSAETRTLEWPTPRTLTSWLSMLLWTDGLVAGGLVGAAAGGDADAGCCEDVAVVVDHGHVAGREVGDARGDEVDDRRDLAAGELVAGLHGDEHRCLRLGLVGDDEVALRGQRQGDLGAGDAR